MEKELFANFRYFFKHAKVIEVLKIEVNEGEGSDCDPVHRVAYVVSKSGKVLGKIGSEDGRKFTGEDEMIFLN